jgi:hypothetical protein
MIKGIRMRKDIRAERKRGERRMRRKEEIEREKVEE